jgi:hypothetical protein
MKKIKRKNDKIDIQIPDKIPLTSIQADRLASISGLDARQLKGKTIADIAKSHAWKIDPKLLFFQKVCGKVVKRDPVTNELLPVPYATVHVEDTDCNLMGFFPSNSKWNWFFPLLCKRETITSVLTDACGNFCVYIPRFEIDWILRWRKNRICFPIIFERPTLRDILDDLLPEPPRIKWPFPDPDPGPLLRNGGLSLDYLEQFAGVEKIEQLSMLQSTAQLGDSTEDIDQLLDSVAYSKPLPPPLPTEVRQLCADKNTQELASRMAIADEALVDFNHRYFIGPFKRCFDIYFPQWQQITDVPDITFRVTQDVDGDGDEETIYSEGLFDVRWNDQNIPDVVLEASQIALVSADCNPVGELPCGSPEVVLAGKMPLHNEPGAVPPYVDINGYSKRVNRPHPSGQYNETLAANAATASSPLGGFFPLYGCNKHKGAKFYRLRYVHTPENSVTPLAKKTFQGHSWNLYRWVGHLEKLAITPDADGWYEILDLDDGWMPAYLLLNWPTHQYSDGLYEIEMELANSGKSVVHTTGTVKARIDNSRPIPRITKLRWSLANQNNWHDVGLNCPVISRPVGQDIDMEVSYEASADHLRSMILTGQGCGAGGTLQLISGINSVRWWHRNAADNYEAKTAVYRLAGTMLPGAYGFHLAAQSRAFNPVSSAGLSADWFIDLNHIWRNAALRVSVVDV